MRLDVTQGLHRLCDNMCAVDVIFAHAVTALLAPTDRPRKLVAEENPQVRSIEWLVVLTDGADGGNDTHGRF